MPLITNYFITTSFVLTNVMISNVQIAPSKRMLGLGTVLDFAINNSTIQNVTSLDSTDIESSIFSYSTIVLENPFNYTVSNIDYSNSSVRLFEISSFIPPASMTKYFNFENIYFHD